MDVTGHGKSDKEDKSDEAGVETQINLVSPFAHPRVTQAAPKLTRFDLRQFVTSHPIPVALSCLALGGAIAAVILKRRRHDSWDARIDRLRQAFANTANSAG